jgi:hypothetical protein
MFAEIGFTLCRAFLYNIADTVQQIAAPKAASSPIIDISLRLQILSRLK